jgi:hypothetical protein
MVSQDCGVSHRIASSDKNVDEDRLYVKSRISTGGHVSLGASCAGPARGLAPACGEDGAVHPGLRRRAGSRRLERPPNRSSRW